MTNRLSLPPGECTLWTVNNNYIAICQHSLLSLYDSYSLQPLSKLDMTQVVSALPSQIVFISNTLIVMMESYLLQLRLDSHNQL